MTAREQRFCYLYHTLRSAREAVLQAGYLPPLAERTAVRLLQRVDVLQEIDALDEARARRDLQKAVQSGLERLAFGGNNDSLRLASLGGNAELLERLDLFRISECKLKGDAVELKFYDRYHALALLSEVASAAHGGDVLKSLFQSAEFLREEEPDAVFPKTDPGTDLVDAVEPSPKE